MRALLVVVLSSLAMARAEPARPPAPGGGLLPAIQPARGGECIADPATMRRDHMNLLRHQRDDTVRSGVRGAKASLKGCVDCHAGTTSGSVASAGGDFCVSCHAYAAVKIDCFECHASRPAAARVAGGRP